ncbi:MAG: DUF2892 domain-containing protein [Gammaproteobacteria bacterium HGW-Gammaproteobacteria-3]|jgi:hypothetical protein|nr:MAG: DUF2892 domain-containing protein [Gammaproteobacteria bacterium HGW-Gammaproteobacteria-3]
MSFDYKRVVKFEHNLGEVDKKYRMMGGIALVVLSIFSAKILLILIGIVLIATSYTGWCPVYSGFGKNTCTVTGDANQADAPEEKNDSEKS